MSMITNPSKRTGARPAAPVVDLTEADRAPVLLSSRVLQQVGNELRSGRHPLLTGPVGDRVLLQGEVFSLPDALERMGRGPFDVVLRVNAVDDISVVTGEEAYRRILSGTPVLADQTAAAPDGSDDSPERERRLATLRARTDHIEDEDPIAVIRRCLRQCDVGVVVIVEQADILLQDPANHDQHDRDRVGALQLALRDAAWVGRYRNTCIMIAGQASDVPPVLLAGTEEIGLVDLPCPSRAERVHLLSRAICTMHGADQLDADGTRAIVDELAGLTDGESLSTLQSLAAFSRAGQHSVLQPNLLVNLHRFGDRPDYWTHLRPTLAACRERLEAQVFGQPGAIEAVIDALAAAALGLDLSGRPLGAEGQPRGIFWFVGPTGVGKTELAKAIAEAVFGDAEAYTRIDMSTFSEAHSAERLLGAPPGFVGFEQGGELTNPVRLRPNSVILLDEIEKAHPEVIQRFMSIFDDGRVSDAQGRVTYFGETIIIATSNEGSRDITELLAREGEDVTYQQVAAVSVAAVRRYFEGIGRIEIFGRIAAGMVPFDVLRDDVIGRIATKFASAASFRNGPALDVDAPALCNAAQLELRDPTLRALGGRQVRNFVQQKMRELASWLALEGYVEASTVQVSFEGSTMFAAVDAGPPVPVRR